MLARDPQRHDSRNVRSFVPYRHTVSRYVRSRHIHTSSAVIQRSLQRLHLDRSWKKYIYVSKESGTCGAEGESYPSSPRWTSVWLYQRKEINAFFFSRKPVRPCAGAGTYEMRKKKRGGRCNDAPPLPFSFRDERTPTSGSGSICRRSAFDEVIS